MISMISGIFAGNDDDGAVVVMSGGLGYAVVFHDRDQASVNVRGQGSEVFAYTRLVKREDADTLYGFRDQDDRLLFDHLLRVDGIGPSTAMKILSLCPAQDFRKLVQAKAVATIRKIPGVGPKTVTRLLEAKL